MLTLHGGEELDFRTRGSSTWWPSPPTRRSSTITPCAPKAATSKPNSASGGSSQQRREDAGAQFLLLTVLDTARNTPHILGRHAAMRKAMEHAIFDSLLAVIGNGVVRFVRHPPARPAARSSIAPGNTCATT
jgi:hypothetical protein